MEFGRGMWTYATIAHAARQDGRYCLDASKVQVTATWADGVAAADVERGNPVKVQVTYPFQFVAAGLLVGGGGTIQMSSTTQMTVLN